jgi:hypothetical protein
VYTKTRFFACAPEAGTVPCLICMRALRQVTFVWVAGSSAREPKRCVNFFLLLYVTEV